MYWLTLVCLDRTARQDDFGQRKAKAKINKKGADLPWSS